MKIEVITERCIGAGNCVEVAPAYFAQGESDGIVILLNDDVAQADEEIVLRAIDICPVAAILQSN
jgi:ferredoxin